MAKIINGRPVAIGDHSTGKDYEKLNWAAMLGWKVLRVTPKMVQSGEAIQLIETALELWRLENG